MELAVDNVLSRNHSNIWYNRHHPNSVQKQQFCAQMRHIIPPLIQIVWNQNLEWKKKGTLTIGIHMKPSLDAKRISESKDVRR